MPAPGARPIANRGELAMRAAHALAASADIETLQRILGLDPETPHTAAHRSSPTITELLTEDEC